jgi:hypothetical protein
MQSTHASSIEDTPNEICAALTLGEFPNGIGFVDMESNVMVKCFDADDPCFDDGVPMKEDGPTECSFAVIGGSIFGDTVIIQDTIPAEWELLGIEPLPFMGDVCDAMEANTGGQDNSNGKAKPSRSATQVECVLQPFTLDGFTATVETRESPSGKFFKPTFCGTFELNSGAVMLQGDQFGDPVLEAGEPIVLAETGPLEVEAVGEDCDL